MRSAERMKAMRAHKRLVLPDARTRIVCSRVAREVAQLDSAEEVDALDWMESTAKSDAQ